MTFALHCPDLVTRSHLAACDRGMHLATASHQDLHRRGQGQGWIYWVFADPKYGRPLLPSTGVRH